MDMKRILQAMDGVTSKPAEGVDSMAKFLRTVTEAEINPPTAQIPAMPDITGLQAGQPKDMGDGSKVTVNADGTVSYQGGWGTYVYNAQGQHIKTQSPSMAGYSQETDPTGNVTQQNYNQGPMNIQKGPQGTTANYQLGADKLQTSVQEGIDKFLSIVKKNDVSILNEGSNPHKVALPVQMAMQHYQQAELTTNNEPSLLKKYFHKVEEEVVEEKNSKTQLIHQYASTIAKRVLMKENTVPGHSMGFEPGPGPGMGDYEVDEMSTWLKNDPDGHTLIPHGGMGSGKEETWKIVSTKKLQQVIDMINSGNYSGAEHTLYKNGYLEGAIKALARYEEFKIKQGKRPIAKGKEIDLGEGPFGKVISKYIAKGLPSEVKLSGGLYNNRDQKVFQQFGVFPDEKAAEEFIRRNNIQDPMIDPIKKTPVDPQLKLKFEELLSKF